MSDVFFVMSAELLAIFVSSTFSVSNILAIYVFSKLTLSVIVLTVVCSKAIAADESLVLPVVQHLVKLEISHYIFMINYFIERISDCISDI